MGTGSSVYAYMYALFDWHVGKRRGKTLELINRAIKHLLFIGYASLLSIDQSLNRTQPNQTKTETNQTDLIWILNRCIKNGCVISDKYHTIFWITV